MLFDKHWKKWIRKHNCKLANGTAALHKNSTLILEEQVRIGHMEIRASNLTIGAHSIIRSTGKLDFIDEIGRFCLISSDPQIGHEKYTHPTQWVSMHPFQYTDGAPLTYNPPTSTARIGNDVWMGTNVTLLEGVQVGTGAIVASKSVVTKDVPPYAIVAGNPAKIVKYRFPEDICQGLLASEWWNYPIEILRTLPMNQPVEFLKEITTIPAQQAHYKKIKVTRKGCEVL